MDSLPEPPEHWRRFDRLAVHEATRLLRAIAEEESGLSTPSATGMNAHCASRDHAHKAGGNTESLSVRPSDKYQVKREGKDVPSGGFVCCYGACGFKGRLSQYLMQIGPEGAASKFWTSERVNTVCSTLESDKPLSLGWLEWKRAEGLPSNGFVARDGAVRPVTTASKQTYTRFLRACSRLGQADDASKAAVCEKRGWGPAVVDDAVAAGILSLRPSINYPDDTEIAFAYKGLFPSRYNPVRLIKTRLLNRGVEEAPLSRETILNPFAEAVPLADFSSAGISFQSSPWISIVEGEPDSLAWRTMRPDDGLLCAGNEHAYQRLMDILPSLHLEGRNLLYALDKDVDSNGHWKKAPHADFALMRAMQEHGAKVHIWVCPTPRKSGIAHKDVNDFLLMSKGRRDPLEYSLPVNASDVKELISVTTKLGLRPKPPIEEIVGKFERYSEGLPRRTKRAERDREIAQAVV